MKFEEPVTEEVFAAAVAKVCGQDVAEKFLKNSFKTNRRIASGCSFSGWFVWHNTPEGWGYWDEQRKKFEVAPQPEEV